MLPADNSYVAVQYLDNATLVLCAGAGTLMTPFSR